MATPALVHQDGDERIWTLHLEDPEGWPTDLKPVDGSFRLLLVMDASNVSDQRLFVLAEKAIAQGAAYLCSSGPGCKRIHDLFDVAFVGDGSRDFEEHGTLMTTSHEGESLDEVLWFFVACAFPDERFAPRCLNWLAVTIDDHDSARLIDDRLRRPRELFSLLEEEDRRSS